MFWVHVRYEFTEKVGQSSLDKKSLEAAGFLPMGAPFLRKPIAAHLSHTRALRSFLSAQPEAATALLLDDTLYMDPSFSSRTLHGVMSEAKRALPADWELLYLARCHDSCKGPSGSVQIRMHVLF